MTSKRDSRCFVLAFVLDASASTKFSGVAMDCAACAKHKGPRG